MNRHTINEGFGAPLFSVRARVAFGSGITPLADRDVPNVSATEFSTLTEKYEREGSQMGFLILTRRTSESVMVGNNIKVTVLGVKGNQVRIGFDVPRNVPVHREEIYERIKREKAGEDPDGNT